MEIKDIPVEQITSKDGDYLILQDLDTGITYKITTANFLARLSSSPTTSASIDLTFLSSGDSQGVLYYIGSSRKTQPWSNPINKGVEITASSVGSGAVSLLLDRQDNEFYTGNSPDSWIKINLFASRLQCSYYSLRNRNRDDHFLRNWKLQGSNNDIDWIDLDIQNNNTSLNAPSQWLSLPVSSNAAYSIFRLLETGLNSLSYYYLCLGEIELYGLFTP
ncbi:hypothetical protein [Nostoc sp. 'Peltigera malacea cyanobiont' DB3992]|uniref:hypothetical protein n=1 Tax=Nostoc sp. 'Peltigera malacea cyanobiont' DB3992 TaxID=1206980 RepID=UPI000C04709D|nr:hypothetical protein [Nostoc sp. 'Peltigera malacea cyanobiont' DB3992]PHM05790.1 hypothetical protein CK516_38345 [Nostoc sp. 'Peltigera malacea cyanobiont' DB3992]